MLSSRNRLIMENQTRNCQNCKKDFTIEPEDLDFYKKIDVPPPTFCPQCRMIRRLCVRNERSLYKNTCQLCKKETISVYSPDKDLTIYCPECYVSDKWDPLDYGWDYDFNRSLFEQLNELFRAVPRPARNETNVVNCNYCEDCTNSKNCYLCFGAYHCDQAMYSYVPLFSKNIVDVTFGNQNEMAYEAGNCRGVYRVRFVQFADECLDSSLLLSCVGCSDCFGCINLQNKKYYIFNQPYSKKDYQEEIKKWDIGSYSILQKAQEKFKELSYSVPYRNARIINGQNCTGDLIRNAKNCKNCFGLIEGAENLKYVYIGGLSLKDSYDAWGAAEKTQLVYEVTGCGWGDRVMFTNNTHNCTSVQYSNKCFSSSDLFGCCGLKKKKYCIFNKAYSKEEYLKLRDKIIAQAKEVPYIDGRGREYRYGEFFPFEHMPVAYNEALVSEKFPISKEEAIKQCYPWFDAPKREYKITKQPSELPDHINDVPDDITKEVIGCLHAGQCEEKCTEAFKITTQELEFYRQLQVPLPRLCPNCRHFQREQRRNNIILYPGQCQCMGAQSKNQKYKNTVSHVHGQTPCAKEFQTTFEPDREEIVYCEDCYQAEVI